MKRDANEEKQKKQPHRDLYKKSRCGCLFAFWNRDQL